MKKLLTRLSMILTLKCDQASLLMSDSLDRKLTWYEWLALKGHFLACSVCPKLLRELHLIRDAGHRHPDHAPAESTPSLSDNAKQRMKDALRSAEGPLGDGGS